MRPCAKVEKYFQCFRSDFRSSYPYTCPAQQKEQLLQSDRLSEERCKQRVRELTEFRSSIEERWPVSVPGAEKCRMKGTGEIYRAESCNADRHCSSRPPPLRSISAWFLHSLYFPLPSPHNPLIFPFLPHPP